MPPAPGTILWNVVTVAPLAPGASVDVPHGIIVGFRPRTPNAVSPDRATPIVVDAVDDQVVTFRNAGLAVETASFVCELTFSSQRDPSDLTVLYWQGTPGGGGGGGSAGKFVLPFTAADGPLAPLGVVPLNAIVWGVLVEVTTAFSPGATLRVGDALNNGRLVDTLDNLPQVVGQYSLEPSFQYPVAMQANLYIGGAPVAGGGRIVLYYV